MLFRSNDTATTEIYTLFLLNAHIHAGPAVTPITNGPVVWGFFGSPLNDVAPNDFTMTPFASGVGGTFSGKWDLGEGNATTLTAQLPNILAGRSYINFHTTQFGGGEIRGNIVAMVPEPESYALMLAGLAVHAIERRPEGGRVVAGLGPGRGKRRGLRELNEGSFHLH